MPEERIEARITERFRGRENLFRVFDLHVPRIIGINQTLPPNLIGDDEFQEIWNLLPTAQGSVVKLKKPKKLVSITKQAIPVKIFIHPIGGVYQGLVFYDDGSIDKWDGTTLTGIAPAGTLSGDPALMDCCVWQNQTFYIIDYNKGYFKWTGTGFSQVSSGVKGTTLTVWQGRMFVGCDSRVYYSVALNAEDFAGQGSGWFDLAESFPTLKLTVKKIVPYVDTLLVYGDSAIMGLTGSTISNDPSQWYLTELSSTVGVKNANNVCVYRHETWLYNEKGLFRVTASAQEKFDYNVDLTRKVELLNLQSTICPINNLLCYLIPAFINSPQRGKSRNILVYCIDTNRFFFIDPGVDVYGIYHSYVEGVENRIYILSRDGLYALNEGTGFNYCMLRSKQFDLQRPTMEKLWWMIYLPFYTWEGDRIYFTIQFKTEQGTVSKDISLTSYGRFALHETDEGVLTGLTFEDKFLIIGWDFLQSVAGIQYILSALNNIGNYCEVTITENSDSVIELTNFSLKIALGRDYY